MKRPRGFRTITVGTQVLFWQFRPAASELVVVAGGSRLIVRLPNWRDPWLTLSDVHVSDGVLTLESSARNDPPIVGPRFVRQAIDFALMHGWKPLERGRDVQVVSSAGAFECCR
ncbi:MAG: hypothetical protein JNM69_41255 [Archangium sp.]|nr:hypothetical protein [Archangium sp.]